MTFNPKIMQLLFKLAIVYLLYSINFSKSVCFFIHIYFFVEILFWWWFKFCHKKHFLSHNRIHSWIKLHRSRLCVTCNQSHDNFKYCYINRGQSFPLGLDQSIMEYTLVLSDKQMLKCCIIIYLFIYLFIFGVRLK
jgi:hypothetical protein